LCSMSSYLFGSTTPMREAKLVPKLPVRGRDYGGLALAAKGKGKRKSVGEQPSLPPSFNATPTVHQRFRFRASGAASGVGVAATSIIGALGVIGTVTNSDVASWASSFKIRSVTIWPPQVAGSDLAFLEWTAGSSTFTKDETKVMAIPDGITATGPVVFRPPPKSLYSDWIAAGNAGFLFTITCATGSIIDLDVDYTTSVALSNLIIPVATAVIGTVYYLALDGATTNKFVPVALPTTH